MPVEKIHPVPSKKAVNIALFPDVFAHYRYSLFRKLSEPSGGLFFLTIYADNRETIPGLKLASLDYCNNDISCGGVRWRLVRSRHIGRFCFWQSKLIKNTVSGAPGFNIENIFVFAGVPSIAEAMTKEFLKIIKVKNKFYSTSVITKLFESKIAHILEKAEGLYSDVSIGSYPIFDGKPRGVEIVISSMSNKPNALKVKKFITTEINKII